MYHRMFFVEALFIFLCIGFPNVLSTEISEGSSTTYEYFGLSIKLPILLCHVRDSGYKKVIWMKDFVTVKTGSSDLKSHILSLSSLLDTNASIFDSPFKLQGYYRCETDVSTPAYVHDYLFQIDNIYTYVGKLVSRNDSLGEDDTLTFEEKLSWKKQIFEIGMETVLFREFPNMNVSVTDIKVLKEGGLEVHFYLYLWDILNPRKKFDTRLDVDEQHYLDILHFLENEITSTENNLIYSDWIDLEGISMEDVELKSTLGCYRDVNPENQDSPIKVNWPSARIGEVVIPENSCLTEDGLAVTRLCTGSFHSGAKWGMPSGNCGRPPNDITLKIKDIYLNYERIGRGSKIEKLVELTEFPSALGVSDLHILADILSLLSRTPKLNRKEVRGILSVIDKTMETNKTELVAAKNIMRLTTRFLEIIGNVLKDANEEEKEIRISKQHLIVETKFIEEISTHNLILGLTVTAPNIEESLYNGSVNFLRSTDKLPKQGSIAHFALPKKLVQERVARQDIPRQVNMVFFQNWNLFQNPRDVLIKRNYKVLPTPVMYISVSGGPAWNLTDPIQLYFKDMVKDEIENPVCVFYDPRLDEGAGAWSSEGCEYKGLKQGYYHCQCHHLSIFAVILSQSPYTFEQKLSLGTSVYVGCSVSILALSLSVLLFILSKNWRRTIDHCILFCLSLTFLACILLIFISEMHFKGKYGCILLSMIFHYTIFAIFGWLMVLAVIYRLRFAMKTDLSEIPHFIMKAAFSVWGTPIIIVVIIWFTQDFPFSVKDGCLLTMHQVTRVSVIPVVVLICVTLCINLCATYSLTCRYKKDFMINDTDYNDVVVKFRVAFTIFFFFALCWLFGFLAAYYRSKTLKILFSITLTLTAYYVSLFFIFQEDSFWELCKSCKKQEEHELEHEPVAQYNNKTYKSDEETVVKEQ